MYEVKVSFRGTCPIDLKTRFTRIVYSVKTKRKIIRETKSGSINTRLVFEDPNEMFKFLASTIIFAFRYILNHNENIRMNGTLEYMDKVVRFFVGNPIHKFDSANFTYNIYKVDTENNEFLHLEGKEFRYIKGKTNIDIKTIVSDFLKDLKEKLI